MYRWRGLCLMNHRHLIYFIEVYKSKSIKKSAEYLMISPQGISKTIKYLETEMGTVLFKRNGSTLEATRAADELLPHAYRIIDEYRLIENKEYGRRKLVIYSIDSLIDYFTKDFLIDFYKTFPGISLKIIEVPHQSAIDHVKAGDGQLALLQQYCDHPDFDNTYLFSCRFCMVVNRNNPLSQKEYLEMEDLDGQVIAGRGFEYILFDNMIKRLNKLNYHPIVIMESNNEQLLLNLAENDLALACVSERVAQKNVSENTSICILSDEQTYDQIYISHKKSQSLSPEAALFKEFLIDWVSKHF